MMRKIISLGLFCVISLAIFSQEKAAKSVTSNTSLARPKLVVGIVVDQMRWDFLYRYYNRYEKGGFRRLLSEGFTFENAMINYVPSVTAVGHASIYTGSVPALHGITDNYWIEQPSGKEFYCTDDSTVHGVGTDNNSGKMSPRNLLVSTVTDELRIATNFESKVVGVALKDRASILPAGHSANAAFWLDDANGNFITSSYYMNDLPGWVNEFNKAKKINELIKNDWNTLYPIDTYKSSDSDRQVYEGLFPGETGSVFPHKINELYKTSKGVFRSTPFGNTILVDFAEKAIEGYSLGKGKSTDFLTLSFASTDYVGHMFGPNSIEIEDTYLRLDHDLAQFFDYLDKNIGKGRYTIFLSADHGVAHATGYLQKSKLPAGVIKIQAITDSLNKILSEKFGPKKLVRSISDLVIYDMKEIFSKNLDFNAIKQVTINFLQQQPGILFAVDVQKIGESPVPQQLREMIANGYYFKRSSAVRVVTVPGWFPGEEIGPGTGHGTINPYDTHIPLLFMGWGIKHGSSRATVHMTDIAPTVSALLHIQMPDGNIGKVIEDALR